MTWWEIVLVVVGIIIGGYAAFIAGMFAVFYILFGWMR